MDAADLDATIVRHERTIHARGIKIDKLAHELARLRRVQFAAKSERMDPAQRELFDESMAADIAALWKRSWKSFRTRKPNPRHGANRAGARCPKTCHAKKRCTSRKATSAKSAAKDW